MEKNGSGMGWRRMEVGGEVRRRMEREGEVRKKDGKGRGGKEKDVSVRGGMEKNGKGREIRRRMKGKEKDERGWG